jgi:hypothetical protein
MKTYQYKYQEGDVTVKGVIRAADSETAIKKLKRSFDKYYPGDFQLTEIRPVKIEFDLTDYVLIFLIFSIIALFVMYIHYLITTPV